MVGNYSSFALLISNMFFNPFKMAVQFYFSQFYGPNAFFPNSTGPWSQLQKGRKLMTEIKHIARTPMTELTGSVYAHCLFIQGSLRLEMYLNLEGFLEKFLEN